MGTSLRLCAMTGELSTACAAVYAAAYAQPPWGENYDCAALCGYFARFLAGSGAVGWALCEGDTVVGLLLGVVVPHPAGACLRVEDFCVAPACQRQGVGSELLRRAKEQLPALGCDGMTLSTVRGFPSQAFYAANGFRELAASVQMLWEADPRLW